MHNRWQDLAIGAVVVGVALWGAIDLYHGRSSRAARLTVAIAIGVSVVGMGWIFANRRAR